MADWSKPTLTSTYTNYLAETTARDVDCAVQFSTGTITTPPTNAIKWDTTLNRWQKWSGTAWGELTATYALTGLTVTSLSNTGNTTLGDSSADSITFNAGSWSLGSAVTVTGSALAFSNAVSFNGAVTIGDASADTVTVNAASWSFANSTTISGTLTFSGTVTLGGLVNTGQGVSTGDAAFELGSARTGDGNAYFDFHAASGTDYETRVHRFGGANGVFTITNTGTGAFEIKQAGAGDVVIITNNTERLRATSGGNFGVNQASPAAKFDVNGGVCSNITTVAASTVDCTAGNYFTKTVTGALTWVFSSPPASRAFSFLLEVTNGGTGTQTWPTSVKWPGGTAPTLVAAGVDILGFVTDDSGTTWRGVQLMKDSK